MLSRILKSSSVRSFQAKARNFSTTNQNNVKVAVLGAVGGVGQQLCLLLKRSPLVKELNFYDIRKSTPGVAMDLAHVDTATVVRGFTGLDEFPSAVQGVDIIVVPAGLPRMPGMSRDDLFGSNAGIIRDLADGASRNNPTASFCIITNPVNSTLPIATEVYKKNNAYDPKKIIGITTLDISRSNYFVAKLKNLDPGRVSVPVICGHSGTSIIPILSQCKPKLTFTSSELKELTKNIQEAGTKVLDAKAGTGSGTLAMAHAGLRFTESLARSIKGENVIECAMVRSDIWPGVKYFSSPIEFSNGGVGKIFPLFELSHFEKEILNKAIPELKKNIQDGIEFVHKYPAKQYN